MPSQTAPATCTAIETLRRQRHTGKHIAAEVGVSAATVSRILRRLSLNKLSALEPAEPIRRYQRDYANLGVTIERVMTDDNGSCYKSFAFWKRLRLKHISTKPYTPKTNGQAERFVQTSLGEWAYAQAYNTSKGRAAELPRWLHHYNWHRPHSSLDSKPPISTLGLAGNNLLRLHG